MEYPNWFAVTAQANFEQLLTPLAGQNDLKFLQLGVYTGDASVWMLDNVLTGKDASLTDIDTWRGSDEEVHESMDFDDVYKVYLNKVSNRTTHHRTTTTNFLIYRYIERSGYDFIYIDADHTTVGVLMDAELSWPLLKSGGIMAFDDYTWGENLPTHLRAKPGIDLFLLRHKGEYDLLAINSQVWLRKR